jgi:hypothetical protein
MTPATPTADCRSLNRSQEFSVPGERNNVIRRKRYESFNAKREMSINSQDRHRTNVEVIFSNHDDQNNLNMNRVAHSWFRTPEKGCGINKITSMSTLIFVISFT